MPFALKKLKYLFFLKFRKLFLTKRTRWTKGTNIKKDSRTNGQKDKRTKGQRDKMSLKESLKCCVAFEGRACSFFIIIF